MSRQNAIKLTLGQIALGGAVGLVGGGVCLLFFEGVIWRLLIGERVTHGFWVGLLLLISLGVTYGVMIGAASEGVRFVGRQFGMQIPFKPVFSGAILGPPAVVGLLALLDVPWEIFGAPNLILALILPVLKAAAYIVSLPMRGWVTLGLPVEICYVLAVPVGAILGYRLPSAKRDTRAEPT